MYFITTKRMLEVCFSAHPNIQYRTKYPGHRVWAGLHQTLRCVSFLDPAKCKLLRLCDV